MILGSKSFRPPAAKIPRLARLGAPVSKNRKYGKSYACPAGQTSWPVKESATGLVVAACNLALCGVCADKDKRPAYQNGHKAELKFSPKEVRLSQRRELEGTEEFKKTFNARAGVEATNGRLARQTGLRRLRRRGLIKATLSAFCKVLGVNFWRILFI
ncbi:MAG: transposase [Deltaproteobacteria bacterium]|nr:transposase [Deltaproteobacteria bacterium]